MKKFFIITCLVIAVFSLKAQEEITVKFTSTTQIGAYCPFNAVNVSNLSRGWDEVLYYPDTTLSLACSVGLSEMIEISPITVYPNPFSNSTNASFSLETDAIVKIQLFQLNGKEIASFVEYYETGEIQIRVTMSEPQMALLVIATAKSRQVAKILNVGNGNCNGIEATHYASKKEPDGSKANLIGDFMPGDTMRYEAVAYDNGNMLTSEIITKAQYEDETIALEFVVTIPDVNTFEVSNITQTSALGGGEVTLTGGLPVTERGVCWGTAHNPTINQNHNSNGSGIGAYSVNMYGLVQNTTYYVRAYAINGVGISYGQEVHFTTSDNISAPSVTTSQVTNISQNTAVGGGDVTADGGASVTERGICWSTGHNPTINNSHGSNGSGLGNYTVNMTGLSAGTVYYVRAYAINSQGISYGQEVGFTTTAEPPTVTTSQVTNITQTTATGGGDVTSDGGATVTERGICWSTSHNPTISSSNGSSGTGTGSYTVSMTGLTANTTYYVRAYATNSVGTAYGSEVSFTTSQNVTLPTVTTSQVTNITETSATGGGNVISDGGGIISIRGICWSTSHNPTTNNNHHNLSGATGSFSINMNNLTANTTYYVRAYATNGAGTAYGNEVSFTTLPHVTLPTVTTIQVTDIAQTTATGGGNVIDSGNATVTERGICWSTNHDPTTSDNHANSGTGLGLYTINITGLTANTTYYVRAFAINSVGTAYGNEVSFTTSHVSSFLDLGLPSGTLWATCNVGASVPEDYGDYYAWGETQPKSVYDWSTYIYCNGSSNTLTMYCNNSNYGYNGYIDDFTVLFSWDDAAAVNLGSEWRMPTIEEWQELYDNTTCVWTIRNGVNGRLFTASNGNSIFLPAAGYRVSGGLSYAGSNGYYWSSSLYTVAPYCAQILFFSSDDCSISASFRRFGQPVRAVRSSVKH